jgi:hypothetical protein
VDPRRTFRSVSHLQIVAGQVCLTKKFFEDQFQKKMLFCDMSILSILLRHRSRHHVCHAPIAMEEHHLTTSEVVRPASCGAQVEPAEVVATLVLLDGLENLGQCFMWASTQLVVSPTSEHCQRHTASRMCAHTLGVPLAQRNLKTIRNQA